MPLQKLECPRNADYIGRRLLDARHLPVLHRSLRRSTQCSCLARSPIPCDHRHLRRGVRRRPVRQRTDHSAGVPCSSWWRCGSPARMGGRSRGRRALVSVLCPARSLSVPHHLPRSAQRPPFDYATEVRPLVEPGTGRVVSPGCICSNRDLGMFDADWRGICRKISE